LCGATTAAAQDYQYSLSLFGSFTTSSKIFQHPNDINGSIRNQFLPMDNVFGGGIDLRRKFADIRLQFGLSVEYLSRTRNYSVQGIYSIEIPVNEGYTAYPIELSAYFDIPVGLTKVNFYMGGGGGIYFGTHHYEEAGISSKVVELKPAAGIQILCGIEYYIGSRLAVRGEWKFRDIHFKVTNKFFEYADSLQQAQMYSRINIDGMVFNAGMVFYF
jgi:hypothetical protein